MSFTISRTLIERRNFSLICDITSPSPYLYMFHIFSWWTWKLHSKLPETVKNSSIFCGVATLTLSLPRDFKFFPLVYRYRDKNRRIQLLLIEVLSPWSSNIFMLFFRIWMWEGTCFTRYSFIIKLTRNNSWLLINNFRGFLASIRDFCFYLVLSLKVINATSFAVAAAHQGGNLLRLKAAIAF